MADAQTHSNEPAGYASRVRAGRLMYLAMCLVWMGASGAMILFQLYLGLLQKAGIGSVRLAFTALLLWWVARGSKVGRWIVCILASAAAVFSLYFATLVPTEARGSDWFVIAFVALGLFFAVYVLAILLPTPVRTYLNRRAAVRVPTPTTDAAMP